MNRQPDHVADTGMHHVEERAGGGKRTLPVEGWDMVGGKASAEFRHAARSRCVGTLSVMVSGAEVAIRRVLTARDRLP